MVTITEFLTARLDEDEAVALRALLVDGLNRPPLTPTRRAMFMRVGGGDDWAGYHVDASPARVLAEVEAKRRIVAMHGSYSRTFYNQATGTYESAGLACEYCMEQTGDYEGGGPVPWPCDTLNLLALPYADHPDYDEAWRV